MIFKSNYQSQSKNVTTLLLVLPRFRSSLKMGFGDGSSFYFSCFTFANKSNSISLLYRSSVDYPCFLVVTKFYYDS